jgi:hypothetical protein
MKANLILCVLLAAVILMSYAASAADSPVDPGAFILGGSISYSGFGQDKAENYNIRVRPEFHYFLFPGVAVGADLFYDYWKEPYEKTTQIGIGPSIAYYLKSKNPRGFPFARVGIIYTHMKASSTYGYSSEDDGIHLKGSLGYTYFISENIAIAGSADYSYERAFILDIGYIREWREVFGISVGLKAFLY